MKKKCVTLAMLVLAGVAGCTTNSTAPELHSPGSAVRGINGMGGGYVEPAEATAGDGVGLGSGNEVAEDSTEAGRGINGMGGG